MRQLLLLLTLLLVGCGSDSTNYQYGEVTNVTSVLNVRESPNPQSPIVGKIGNGEKVALLSDNQTEWSYIRHGNLTGYVKSSYIKPIDEFTPKEVSSNDWWASVKESKVWTFFSGIGGIVLIVLGICLVAVLFTGVMLIIGALIRIVGSGIGGGFVGLAIGYFVNNGNSDLAVEWMKWGAYIGFGIGLITVLFNPLEEAMGGVDDLVSLASGNGSNSAKKRPTTPVQIHDHPSGESYYHDENGNVHWLRKEENGYREIGGEGFFDDNGYNKGWN